MKDEILEISDKLRMNVITADEAQKELLHLFGVNTMLRRFKNHSEIHSYPSDSFKQKLKKFINKYC